MTHHYSNAQVLEISSQWNFKQNQEGDIEEAEASTCFFWGKAFSSIKVLQVLPGNSSTILASVLKKFQVKICTCSAGQEQYSPWKWEDAYYWHRKVLRTFDPYGCSVFPSENQHWFLPQISSLHSRLSWDTVSSQAGNPVDCRF